MREKLLAFALVLVVGFASVLSASAQVPNQTFEDFLEALNAHQQRMAYLSELFQATLPHYGPMTDYQLRLLAELEGPEPWAVAASSFNCIQSGGGRVDLVTTLDGNDKVLIRAHITKTFVAKPGWKFQDPTATNKIQIKFEGDTNGSRSVATADFKDRYDVGQQAPHGQVGSGRYYVKCYNASGQTYSKNWSWRLFRDCPGHN